MMRAPALSTTRLELRPLTMADAAAVQAYAGSPGFFRFLPVTAPSPYTLKDAEEHLRELEGLERAGYPNWGIVVRGEPAPIGAVRLKPWGDGGDDGGVPELGYGLDAGRAGQGYATEACAAALAWVLRQEGEVRARCDPRNAASLRVLEKLGFRAIGTDGAGRPAFALFPPVGRPKP